MVESLVRYHVSGCVKSDVTSATPTTLLTSAMWSEDENCQSNDFSGEQLVHVSNWSPEEDFDPSNEHKPLLTQSCENPDRAVTLYEKVAAVNWRNAVTVIVAVVDYFLVYASISLIGTFFPTEVISCCVHN